MNFHRKIQSCWWLWALLSVPPIFYFLLTTHEDKAGVVHSDWSDLVQYLSQGVGSKWTYWREIVFWSILVPLVLGWVVQYVLVLAWQARRKRGAQT